MNIEEGAYKCDVCGRTWDSSEVSFDMEYSPPLKLCGDGFCTGNIEKISNEPNPTRNPGV